MNTHDPKEFVRGLQQILISDAKRIGFLAGAGTSIATKKGANKDSSVPGVKMMTENIVKSIKEKKYNQALKIIEEELKENNFEFYIEYILSTITQKEQVVGKGTLCGLRKTEFEDLKKLIESKIIDQVSVHQKYDNFIDNLLHCDFAEWIGQASRKAPIEIFTTNYDYLFEIGLEYHNIPYFDGFVGGYEPFFDSVSVEDIILLPQWTKLWKIHGSLGWDINEKTNKIFRSYRDETKIIVFPSILKYDNSRKQPYLSYIDRLSAFVKKDDGVLFICGYSFGDQHINETLLNALSQTRTSHAIAFYFDDFDESSEVTKLCKGQSNLSIYGKRNAIIAGKFGKWKLKTMPSKDDSIQIDTYFNEDATEPDKQWEGWGELKIVDFAEFVSFLTSLHYENYKTGIEKP